MPTDEAADRRTKAIIDESKALGARVDTLSNTLTISHNVKRLLKVALVLALLTALGFALLYFQGRHNQAREKAHNACVARQLDALTKRSGIIGGASLKRSDTLDAVFLAIDPRAKIQTPAEREHLLRLFDAYRKAALEYKRVYASHPLPEAPKTACK